MVGKTISHYQILEKLGEGGMGVVYKATDSRLGRQVAIKLLRDPSLQDAERLARFKREARVLASLNHANIASIHGLEEENSTHFLVLEYVPGDTLAERLAKRSLPPREALEICRQGAEALEAAHEKGIIHRDLKPANIKITEEGKVKVLDFGLAKALEAAMAIRWMLLAVAVLAMPAAGADCAGLAKLNLPATTISVAEEVTAGAFQLPRGQGLKDLPGFCRVAGVIRPSSDSDIRFEAWMPLTGWNFKFQGIGNGGFAGSIDYEGLADAVRHGYAAASTDTGHRASTADASWAAGHPEKVIDFGYRAIHEMTVKGKAITAAFFGPKPKRSYFNSCSNGGRQALMEAQRYPEDYDGIISGAPANHWTHLLALAVSNMQATAGDASSYIRQSKLLAIQAAALASCDKLDGVEDGVIENPAGCRFDPTALLCQGAETDECLTQPQVRALKKLYGGLRDSKGRLLYPGYAMGGEADKAGWGLWITAREPEKSWMFVYGTGFYKSMVYGDPAWDYRKFNVDADLKVAVSRTAGILNATDPDLRRFKVRGGKLILYHGWCDAAVPAQAVIDYYQSVVRTMGQRSAGEFVRLFMAPGMQHCKYGAGPNEFGQDGVADGDAHTNIAAALERWVEQGVAPEEIIATKNKSASNPMVRTRPLCAYPKAARYKGAGSTDDAANFECVAPGKPKG